MLRLRTNVQLFRGKTHWWVTSVSFHTCGICSHISWQSGGFFMAKTVLIPPPAGFIIPGPAHIYLSINQPSFIYHFQQEFTRFTWQKIIKNFKNPSSCCSFPFGRLLRLGNMQGYAQTLPRVCLWRKENFLVWASHVISHYKEASFWVLLFIQGSRVPSQWNPFKKRGGSSWFQAGRFPRIKVYFWMIDWVATFPFRIREGSCWVSEQAWLQMNCAGTLWLIWLVTCTDTQLP